MVAKGRWQSVLLMRVYNGVVKVTMKAVIRDDSGGPSGQFFPPRCFDSLTLNFRPKRSGRAAGGDSAGRGSRAACGASGLALCARACLPASDSALQTAPLPAAACFYSRAPQPLITWTPNLPAQRHCPIHLQPRLLFTAAAHTTRFQDGESHNATRGPRLTHSTGRSDPKPARSDRPAPRTTSAM